MGDPAEGDLVSVYDNKDEFLAEGHYAPGSIAVRIVSFTHCDTDENFWTDRIRNAYEYRKSIGLIGSPVPMFTGWSMPKGITSRALSLIITTGMS